MRYIRSIIFFLLPIFLFSMQGCGGGNSSGVFNPTSGKSSTGTTATGGTGGNGGLGGAFNNVSTVSGKASISLATDRTTIDANIGQVLATATVVDSKGTGIAGVPVTFSVTAGPATVAPSLVTVNTDAKGKALTVIVPGNTLTTTNVILMASMVYSGNTAFSYGNFQIARGTGIIKFVTDPVGAAETFLYQMDKSIDSNSGGAVFFQQIPFKVLDANGNPRPGVPVTMSVYSHASNSAALLIQPSVVTIDYLQNPVGEPSQQTVTTDSRGEGIFNVTVLAYAPGAGLAVGDSIVFKAVTNDTNALVGYVGLQTTLSETLAVGSASLKISPQTASFLASDVAGATRSFGISGGSTGAAYTVSSSNPNLVTVSLSGTSTAVATLADASAWTGSVFITVTDSTGATASATITRQ